MLPAAPYNPLQTANDFYNVNVMNTSDEYAMRVNLQFGGRFQVILIASFSVRSTQLRKILNKTLHTETTPVHTQILSLYEDQKKDDLIFRALSNHADLISPIILEVMTCVTSQLDKCIAMGKKTNPSAKVHSIRITNEPHPIETEFSLCKSSLRVKLPFLIEVSS